MILRPILNVFNVTTEIHEVDKDGWYFIRIKTPFSTRSKKREEFLEKRKLQKDLKVYMHPILLVLYLLILINAIL